MGIKLSSDDDDDESFSHFPFNLALQFVLKPFGQILTVRSY